MSVNEFLLENLEKYVVSIVSFLALYWSLSFGQENRKGLYLRDIYKINYLLCITYILFTFGPFSFKYTSFGEWESPMFTMGLGNPNAVAVYVMFSIIILLIQLQSIRRGIYKCFNISIIVTLIYILLKLSSRTVLVCVIAILVYGVVRPRRKIGKIFPYLIMIIPIMMIPIQLYIGEQSNTAFKILGKSLATGRSDVYEEVLTEILSTPISFLFGNFSKYSFGNMHNAPLAILASIGVIGLLLYFAFRIHQINILNKFAKTNVQKIAFVSLLAFIIHSSSEAMTMIGTIPYGVLLLVIVKIAKGDFQDDSQPTKIQEVVKNE